MYMGAGRILCRPCGCVKMFRTRWYLKMVYVRRRAVHTEHQVNYDAVPLHRHRFKRQNHLRALASFHDPYKM